MARIGVQEGQKVQTVQEVQKVQGGQKVQGVQLRHIRGRKGIYWTRLNGIERKLNK